jgi:hypothetical protein
MNVKEFMDFGFYLVETLTEANKFYFKSAEYDNAAIGISYFQDKVEKVKTLFNNSQTLKKIEDSGLLRDSKMISATADERVSQFELICELIFDLANSEQDWQTHFEVNLDKYVDVWEYPERWERRKANNELRQIEEAKTEAERQKILIAESKIISAELLAKPPREIPCFYETRKNGLNCNNGDLVEIAKLPQLLVNSDKYSVSVKKCRQCWQVYKEFVGFDSSINQFLSRYLKPSETVEKKGFYFSVAEAEEFDKIDFKVFFNPNLKN